MGAKSPGEEAAMINQGTGLATVTQSETAGFGVRLGAYLIDLVIITVPELLLRLLLGPAVGTLLGFVGGVGYYVYFWSSSGATPGKMMLGLRVVSAETGEIIDVGTAILRYVGYIVSGIPLLLGFLWVLWDPNKQGWHDKIAKTRVVRVG
jgi:uncharacterized RDD family membrane protein YckC